MCSCWICNGRQVVLHVVLAGNQDAVCGKQLPLPAALGHHDGAVFHIHAFLQGMLPAEQLHPAGSPSGHLMGQIVVPVEDSDALFPLPAEDVLLGQGILLHGLVDVQVVGRQVGEDGNVRAGREGHELEGGQLQHRNIVWRHCSSLREQGLADIPPQMDGVASVF